VLLIGGCADERDRGCTRGDVTKSVVGETLLVSGMKRARRHE
jgi:hypothetical protein